MFQTNQEAVKLLLIAIIAPLPFAFYGVAISVLVFVAFRALIIYLLYFRIFFPRHVLTRHFWTETQKEKFWRQFFKDSHKPQIQALTSFTCPKYTVCFYIVHFHSHYHHHSFLVKSADAT